MKFESQFKIGEEVEVKFGEGHSIPNYVGQVVKVSFTKSKVYYDVLADQDAVVYHNIVSENVNKVKK